MFSVSLDLREDDPRRYILIASYACPFARRTLLTGALLGLNDLEVSIVSPVRKDGKWAFGDDVAGSTGHFPLDKSAIFLADVYQKFPLANWDNVNSVPYLIDKQTKTGVSNGSGDIVKILLTKFKRPAHAADVVFTAPEAEYQAIADELSKSLAVLGSNAGKAQKAEDQKTYDEAIDNIDKSLAAAEEILSKKKFLNGDKITLSDLLLWSFYLGWDSHFQVVSGYIKPLGLYYPNIARYVKDVAHCIPGDGLNFVYNQLQIDANRAGSATMIRKMPRISYL